ncbi:MAG TPA: HDOD domain-containing protein [Bryobacteraceae bacterium]|nr:HDOD domain-containing protein [Bryobacteraceae bacterium]
MERTVMVESQQAIVTPPPPAPETDFQTDLVTIPVKLCNLPPFSAIANRVMALSTDDDVDLQQLAKVIEGDPAFAADVLLLANSSLFGFPSRMHSLRHAIAILGLDRIKALAITVAMRAFLGQRNPLVRQCWQHSVACALVSEELAAIFDISSDRAYTAGIMHDIGRLGLIRSYAKEMGPVLAAQHEDMDAVLRAERDAVSVDHGRAGSWLVKTWALPSDFSEVCERHHQPHGAGDSDILTLVQASCKIADVVGFPAVSCIRQPTYEESVAALAPRLGRQELPLEEDLRANVTARLAALQY